MPARPPLTPAAKPTAASAARWAGGASLLTASGPGADHAGTRPTGLHTMELTLEGVD
jgi:hypothetical protein